MKIKIFALLAAAILLAGCGAKTTTNTITPTPTPKLVEMPITERPSVSLTPSADGHYLTLNLVGIPASISSIEYELLYNAGDNGAQIEKGIGDTLKEITAAIERKLLLGTESCTSGCKYSYDKGVTGGTLTLNFIDKNGQMSTFETPFTLKSTADLKKDGSISLATENFSVPVKAKLTGSDYFVLINNYRGGYSIYSSSKNSMVGDYQNQ
jgi:hypothetical protein